MKRIKEKRIKIIISVIVVITLIAGMNLSPLAELFQEMTAEEERIEEVEEILDEIEDNPDAIENEEDTEVRAPNDIEKKVKSETDLEAEQSSYTYADNIQGTPITIDLNSKKLVTNDCYEVVKNTGGSIEKIILTSGEYNYSYYITQADREKSSNVCIEVKEQEKAEITIDGLNMISNKSAPIKVNTGAKAVLTIKGENYLDAVGAGNSAGIEVNKDSEIQIKGAGMLEVRGGTNGAGIGGGHGADGGSIIIEGGVIKASCTGNGAGIGGGNGGSGGDISIKNGEVYILTEDRGLPISGGAGIGGGHGGKSGKIIIEGGYIEANITKGTQNHGYGAGIGSGTGANAEEIIITGGEVEVTGGRRAAGIGGGYAGHGGKIIIAGDAKVTAYGGTHQSRSAQYFDGHGIGAGVDANSKATDGTELIFIGSDTDVVAFSNNGSLAGAIEAVDNLHDVAGYEEANIVYAYFSEYLSASESSFIKVYDYNNPSAGFLRELELKGSYCSYAYTTKVGERVDYHLASDPETGKTVQVVRDDGTEDIRLESHVSPYTGIKVKFLEDNISGRVWHDKDKDGYIGESENALSGVTVHLYEKVAGEYVDTGLAIPTDRNGEFYFGVLSGIYQLRFSDYDKMSGFTFKAASDDPKIDIGSRVNADGRSDDLAIEKESENKHLNINAGYVGPDVDNNIYLEKGILEQESSTSEAPNYVKEIEVDEEHELLQYKITVKLPEDMSLYYSLELQDILTEGLKLWGDVEESIQVYVNGEMAECGRFIEADNGVAYQFTPKNVNPEDDYPAPFAYLANTEITMYVQAVLDNSAFGINSAKVVINEAVNKTIEITENKEGEAAECKVSLKGKFTGMAFSDKNANKVYDDKDIPKRNVPVSLYDGKTEKKLDQTFTDREGRFSFPIYFENDYYVEFPTSYGLEVLGEKSIEKNGSAVAPDTGKSDVVSVAFEDRMVEIFAGYVSDGTEIPGFTHYVKSENGYGLEKEIFDTSESLTYQTILKMPPADKIEEYSAMELYIYLDEGLYIENEKDLEITVGGVNMSQMVSYEPNGNIITYNPGAQKEIVDLANKELILNYKAKIKPSIQNYPVSGFVNEGVLSINSSELYPEEGDPVVFVRGKIKGKTFDGITGGAVGDIDIQLYKKTKNGEVFICNITSDKIEGTYEVNVELEEIYVLKFAKVKAGKGLMNKTETSHVYELTGNTDDIFISSQSDYLGMLENDRQRFFIINAGYIMPDIKDNLGFTKTVSDTHGGYTDKISITEKEQELEYRLSFTLPQNMEGYQSLRIEDDLPDGLVLSRSDLFESVRVQIAGENNVLPVNSQTLIQENTLVYYTFPESYNLQSLQGKTIVMTVYAKLDEALEHYAGLELKNKGRLIINKDPEGVFTEEPEVRLKTIIKGTIFDDDNINRNNKYDLGEEWDVVAVVKLYTMGDSGKYDNYVGSAEVINGKYMFLGDMGVSYVVEFPNIIEKDNKKKQLVEKGDIKDKYASHANNTDGRTADIIADDFEIQLNAGYTNITGLGPDVDKAFIDLNKKALDSNGKLVEEYEITEVDEEIKFAIQFRLPSDLTGYQSIEIIDDLPPYLEPISKVTSADLVKVTAKAGSRELPLTGTVSYSGNKLSYFYENIENLISFANGESLQIIMEVRAVLKDDIEIYPDKIKNSARLIINEDIEVDEDGNGEEPDIDIYIKGKISGTMFEDMNENGVVDEGDLFYDNKEVILWKKVTSGRIEAGRTKTGKNGSYSFTVDMNAQYQVEFLPSIGLAELIEKSAIHNGSHAEQDTGLTEFVTVTDKKDGREQILNAGYYEERKGRSFSKLIRDEAGNLTDTLYLTDVNAVLEYELEAVFPEDMSRYTKAGIKDILPPGLTFAERNPVQVLIDGKVADDSDGELTFIREERMVFFDFNQDKVPGLGGKNVIMSVKAVLEEPDNYPEGVIRNQGILVLGEKEIGPDTGNPDVEIKGEITGKTFLKEGGVTLANGERPDISIELFYLAENGTYQPAGQSITVKLGESYRFIVDLEQTYKVQFSYPAGTAGLIERGERADNSASHADRADGFSYEMTVSDKLEGGQRQHVANAGYTEPRVDKEEMNLKKMVKDENGKYQSTLNLTDKDQILEYAIIFTMPEDMEGYQSIEIIDILPDALTISGALEDAVKVSSEDKIYGKGVRSLTMNEQEISCLFTHMYGFSLDELANKEITLEIKTVIREDWKEKLPDELTNKGRLVINQDKDGIETPGPERSRGTISGYVFLDENKNDTRDTQDTPLKNVTIQLERYDGSKWVLADETETNDKGLYIFENIPYGQYRIKVINKLENAEFIVRSAGVEGFDGIRSDVNADGIVEFTLNQQNIHPSAGLKVKQDDSGGDGGDGSGSGNNGGGDGNNGDGIGDDGGNNGDGDKGNDENVFKKMPLDEEIQPGELIDYQISGYGNTLGRNMQKYSITDIFPEGLCFYEAKIPAFTKGAGLFYDVTYRTNKMSATQSAELYKNQPADQVFIFKSPELPEGEYMTHLTVKLESVPHGFGMNNVIVYTCRVDDEPPTLSLINDAVFNYDGKSISAGTKSVRLGGGPKTGDSNDFIPYTLIPITALLIAVISYRYGRKKKKVL